jgi:hypothetical protein
MLLLFYMLAIWVALGKRSIPAKCLYAISYAPNPMAE